MARISDEAQASFAAPWKQLSADGKLLLTAAIYFHPDRVSRTLLKDGLAAIGFDQRQFAAALDRCLDLSLFTGDDPMRLHPLLARYVQEHADDIDLDQRRRIRAELQTCLVQAARAVSACPTDVAAVTALTTFSTDPTQWSEHADASADAGNCAHSVGHALAEIGHFAEARLWAERAVAKKEQGDAHGDVDHASLGRSVHSVGFCLSSLRQFAEAQPWYERAVVEKAQRDIQGRVDHASLGMSLSAVGFCLSALGRFVEAQLWYERAVAEIEQGDMLGRVDHENLGRSLHEVGTCLSSLGQFSEAQPWYERAVAEKEHGDVFGLVDHDSLGASLHQVGLGLLSLGQFAEARQWHMRSVAVAERGDVHGASITRISEEAFTM
jgi:tetratricopeptide (TPR) repeat protein